MSLAKLLSSSIHLKIVGFFDDNPRVIDTADALAVFTGLDPSQTKRALEELAKAKILTVHRTPSAVGYAYTTDKAMLKKIAAYLKKEGKRLAP